MADGAALSHGGLLVEDATFLNIGVFSNGDCAAVTSQHRSIPNADVISQLHIAGNHRAGCDEDLFVHNIHPFWEIISR